jgi:hypothetical protein
MLAFRLRGRIEDARLLAGQDGDRAVIVDVDLVMERANETEFVGDLSMERQQNVEVGASSCTNRSEALLVSPETRLLARLGKAT